VEQHHAVLKERFKGFDIRIESISRLKTKSESEELLDKLENGEIDIIIGTHSLLSDRVKFKYLGLIVIDEEQRFGVKHKERLKVKRIDVNVLSMSATPIPRSLQMSLSGIRDISIISTPPPNRKSIINYFKKFEWNSVFAAVNKEFERNGQAYYLHNRIEDIDAIALKIQSVFPDKVVEVAHGRLPNKVLGKVMSQMASGKIDLLVSTTIIENGIDLPNVNTLIIDDIEHLGLAQMYQIRGRIGRGERQGYAYFLYKSLKGDSKLRLQALEEFSDLGSGFLLANRDLEIRGAGNILGKEQSGVIERVGYHLYLKLLREEIGEFKENLREKKAGELKEMFRFK
jgi:transcription-repair coupling factor (superfamily II helicase)